MSSPFRNQNRQQVDTITTDHTTNRSVVLTRTRDTLWTFSLPDLSSDISIVPGWCECDLYYKSILTLLTLVGVVSSDVSRSSCTTSFAPCCSIFSPSHVFFQGCPCPFLDVINVLHHRKPPSSFPQHHSENASLYNITLHEETIILYSILIILKEF